MAFLRRGFALVPALILILVVVACGGGSSSGSAPSSAIPLAVFGWAPTALRAPVNVSFDARASSVSSGSIATYQWDFGDGVGASGAQVNHRFSNSGIYRVTLTVTSSASIQTSSSQTLIVAANQPPKAAFDVSAPSGILPVEVTFDASRATDADGQLVTFQWEFGGGSSAQGLRTSHTYTQAGDYPVTLTVTDDNGASAFAEQTVVISSTGYVPSYSLSGQISAPANFTIDTDTNDPQSVETANNNLATAQELPNPAVLGGFVAGGVGTGNSGSGDRFANRSDRSDFYRVSLTNGQQIWLEISDWSVAGVDLDLLLYNAQGILVDFSVGLSDTESLTVASSGDYTIEVFANAGYSNYLLGVEPTSSASRQTAQGMTATSPLLPGQLIVDYADAAVLGSAGITTRATALNMVALQTAVGAPSLMTIEHWPAPTKVAELKARGAIGAGTAQKLTTFLHLKTLASDSRIASISANYQLTPQLVPNNSLFWQQWHYPRINLPQAWDISTGSGSLVAVADTGVYLAHTDLSGNLSAGYDFISDPNRSLDGDGIDDNPDDPGDGGLSGSSSWHGTHVAGTVAALTNNNRGVAGVAFGAKVMPLRVLGADGGSSYDIRQAVLYAARLSNASGTLPAQRADVLNLSLGCQSCYSAADQSAYQQAYDAGVIIVASAGNSNTSSPGYPASYAGVVSVSATDRNDQRAPYSNFGGNVDVAAPGGSQSLSASDGVLSTLVDESSSSRRDGYAFYQGTSMAAPHVAGVAALMKSLYPALTPAQFDSALSSGAIVDDLGVAGRDDQFGHGRINALKAVQHAQALAGGTAATALVANPSEVDMGISQSAATVEIDKVGSQSIAVSAVNDNASWLTVEVQSVDSNGLGRYRFVAQRENLAGGAYQATVTFSADNGSELRVRVSLVQGDTASTGVGHIWLMLLDQDQNVLKVVGLDPDINGKYPYRIDGLQAGSYYLLASTDSDNDAYLCDGGEACGVYPTVGVLTPFDIVADTSAADFIVLFGGSLAVDAQGAAQVLPKNTSHFRRP